MTIRILFVILFASLLVLGAQKGIESAKRSMQSYTGQVDRVVDEATR